MAVANPVTTVVAHGDTPAARQLRFHCLCGDDLALAGNGAPGWLSTQGVRIRDGGHGLSRLSFVYGADGESALVIELGQHVPETAAVIEAAMAEMSLEAADRKWRSMMSCLGPVPRPASRAVSTTQRFLLSRQDVVAARRVLHPAPMVDRLMMRDRMLAAEAVEAQLFGQAADHAVRRFA